MDIKAATASYESWVAKQTTLIPADIDLKHTQMASAVFPFLRATFYRWMQRWPEVCPSLTAAPKVLAVGDLHVENFGTWRDSEGRLIWGINDFDEAYSLPYTLDLVRLATSANFAIMINALSIAPKDACKAIVSGYADGLQSGGCPFVLAEKHKGLRRLAMGELRDPEHFWVKLKSLPDCGHDVPADVLARVLDCMPAPGLNYRLATRVAGLGSLGRMRIVAVAEWAGGLVARETKVLVGSGCAWASGETEGGEILYDKIVQGAVRCSDPFLRFKDRWVVRRLAPDCSRVELSSLPSERDETRLLHAMGFETANVHLGTKEAAKAVSDDLALRSDGWLLEACKEMTAATKQDWEAWAGKS
ncbi:MAG TPA: DUF2252 family protein [Blastocatellia bacterium]|nr:DUF2252 family protein [Blastocatellia bacterium]